MVPVVKELWQQATLPWNLPLTILLGLVVVFWSLKILSGADFDSGEGDVDLDDAADAGGFSSDLLRTLNAGAVPLTVILSVLILVLWMSSIALNYYFNPDSNGLLSAGFLLVSFLISLVATKLITQPLVPVMRRLKAAEDTAPVIGETGVVRSIEIDSRYGQIEVKRPHGAPAILNSRLMPEIEPVSRGTCVAIVSYDSAAGVYLVKPISNESNILKS